ncbi:hypothetical protein [Streptomyces olivoreticuli]|uniref:hypothetical protein n=1 Tax=Streptomyces olivoreticuli TaxID=68246 RepID=UPI000E25AD57|nr:hypothetical protein [Streptomyces olivoreticuli]
MTIDYSRTAIRKILEAINHPLRQYDLLLRLHWAAGADPATYRTVRDIPISPDSSEFHATLSAMRADGELVLLPSTEWRRILGHRYNPQLRSGTSYGGNYWYATRAQYDRWLLESEHRAQRLAQIQARLDADGDGDVPTVTVARDDLTLLLDLALQDTPSPSSPSESERPAPQHPEGMTPRRIAEIRNTAASEFRDWEWADAVIDELLDEIERRSSSSTSNS